MSGNHPLDNPVLAALTSKHSKLAVKKNNVLMYRLGTFIMAGIQDTSEATIKDLSELVPSEGFVGFMGFSPNMEPYFHQLNLIQAYQMVSEKVPMYNEVDYVELGMPEVKEMMELVDLTKPGSPFFPGMFELGGYIGVKEDGKLVAMAGERVKLDGYTEIALVCTHPDYRRKGYAASLSGVLMQRIIDNGEIPFLHVMTHNAPAIKLYEKVGFTIRTQYPICAYKRL
ncbi:GNAT family N-acetyltransferase [Candidatus Bathyarchaeota archaeon]|nr:MAG: GNAT family N-acetyltransferase [Candidatus Bathyarchaeota archaeon]